MGSIRWLSFAILSAVFAGITSILAKYGIKKTDSNVATGIRTVVVLIFFWMKGLGVLFIGVGTFLMIEKKDVKYEKKGHGWFLTPPRS